MNSEIVSKILNIVIILGIIVILILTIQNYNVNKPKSEKNSQDKTNENIVINDYEEIQIAYNILYKYMTYLKNDYYEKMVKLFSNQNVVSDAKFQEIKNKLPNNSVDFDDVVITSQTKDSKGFYTIKYSSKYLGECEMVYKINKDNYSFFIKEDSNFGDYYG